MLKEQIDLSAPSFIENPYPVYKYLVENEPVHQSELFGDAYLVSKHAYANEILKSDLFTNNTLHFMTCFFTKEQQKTLQDFCDFQADWLPYLRSNKHKELRQIAHRGFENAIRLDQDLYVKKANTLLDKIINSQKTFDFMRDYAQVFPAQVIGYILGIEEEQLFQIIKCVNLYHDFISMPQFTYEAAVVARDAIFSIYDYFDELFESPDRIREGSMVDIFRNARLPETDASLLKKQLVILIIGGYANSHNVLGNALLSLMQNPRELAKLLADESLYLTAVRELIRFDTSSQLVPRLALSDMDFHGYHFSKDQLIFLLIGAANRDPDVFENPNELNLSRKYNPHLTFGAGAHTCIGLHLTYLTTEIALKTLFARCKNVRLLPGDYGRIQSIAFRGVHSLPITFD